MKPEGDGGREGRRTKGVGVGRGTGEGRRTSTERMQRASLKFPGFKSPGSPALFTSLPSILLSRSTALDSRLLLSPPASG